LWCLEGEGGRHMPNSLLFFYGVRRRKEIGTYLTPSINLWYLKGEDGRHMPNPLPLTYGI
jgi:hypothetical protein